MIDYIQEADGVKVVGFLYANTTAGEQVNVVSSRYTPSSGYLKIEDFNESEIIYLVD
jgi:hypothetical protein